MNLNAGGVYAAVEEWDDADGATTGCDGCGLDGRNDVDSVAIQESGPEQRALASHGRMSFQVFPVQGCQQFIWWHAHV